MKKIKFYLLLLGICLANIPALFSQNIDVTASAGVPTATYPTLSDAFAAINNGVHQGVINIDVVLSTVEFSSAVLNSSGAGAAMYNSIYIRPVESNVVIAGLTTAGRGVIELKGADNVTIDGDNPFADGINKDLSIMNSSPDFFNYTSCIRIATINTGQAASADNLVIKNVQLRGNALGKNNSSFTSPAGSENTTFGIYIGGKGGFIDTDAPAPLISVNVEVMPSGATVNNLLIENCHITACARAIAFMGTNPLSSTGVNILNNQIGNAAPLTGLPPYTTPSTTVYVKGIFVQGMQSVTISGNHINNLISYVSASLTGIHLNGMIGGGPISIDNNTLDGIGCNNNSTILAPKGILIANTTTPYTVSSNVLNNIYWMSGGISSANVLSAIHITNVTATGTIERNQISKIHNWHFLTYGVVGINIDNGINLSIRNNFISDINHNRSGGMAFSTMDGIFGIRIFGGTGHKICNNSVHLSGPVIGTPAPFDLSACLAIDNTGIIGLDVRNNILSNTLTGDGSTAAHVALYLPASGTNAMNLTLNNNTYYCGMPTASEGLAQIGLTPGTGFYQTFDFNPANIFPLSNLRSYTSTLNSSGTNDNASLASYAPAPFISNTNLHIDPLAPNVNDVDSSAILLPGLVQDIDGDTRDFVTPDIGADEFVGVICTSVDAGTLPIGSFILCHGDSANLLSSGASIGAGIGYQWKVSTLPGGPYTDVTAGYGANTITYNTGLLTPGTYYYIMEATCPNGPVTDLSTELMITVNPIPTASIYPISQSCEGDTIFLMGNTDVGTGFVWNGPAGFNATIQNPGISDVTLLNMGIYSLVVTLGPCASEVVTMWANIYPGPTNVMAAVSDTLICQGELVDLSASALDVPIALYTEDFNSGALDWAVVNNSTGGIPANSTWTIRPNGYNPDELADNPSQSWGYINIDHINSNDSSSFFFSNGDAQGDGGIQNNLLISPAINTIGLPNLQLKFYQFFQRYMLLSDSAKIEVSTDSINWNMIEVFTETQGTNDAFSEVNINLDAYINNPTLYIRFNYHGDWSYGWAIDNVQLMTAPQLSDYAWSSTPASFTSTDQNPTGVSPLLSTLYTVTATNGLGCTATATATVIVSAVSVNLGPDIVQPNPPVILDAGAGHSNYLWSTTSNTQTDTVTNNGTYSVVVTNADGCTATDTVMVHFTAGILQTDQDQTVILLYPNPTQGPLNVSIDQLVTDDLVIEIVDITGRMVVNKYIGTVSGHALIPLDTEGLSPGTYVMRIYTGDQYMQIRFVRT